MSVNQIREYAARFEISRDEAERIAKVTYDEDEFITVWENTDWWTDEKNA